MKFDFEVVQKSGIKCQAANVRSRLPTNGSNRAVLEDDIQIMAVTRSSKWDLIYYGEDKNGVSHAEINSDFRNGSRKLLEFVEG